MPSGAGGSALPISSTGGGSSGSGSSSGMGLRSWRRCCRLWSKPKPVALGLCLLLLGVWTTQSQARVLLQAKAKGGGFVQPDYSIYHRK